MLSLRSPGPLSFVLTLRRLLLPLFWQNLFVKLSVTSTFLNLMNFPESNHSLLFTTLFLLTFWGHQALHSWFPLQFASNFTHHSWWMPELPVLELKRSPVTFFKISTYPLEISSSLMALNSIYIPMISKFIECRLSLQLQLIYPIALHVSTQYVSQIKTECLPFLPQSSPIYEQKLCTSRCSGQKA